MPRRGGRTKTGNRLPVKQRVSGRSSKGTKGKGDAVGATNQDEILDAEELNQILIKIRQHCFTHRGVDPGQLFDRWDRDKDGTLDYDELRLLMYKVLTTSEQEFEQLFAFIDKDGDDVISREEFCAFVNIKPAKGSVLKDQDPLGMNHPDKQRDLFFKGLQKKQKVSVVGARWKSDDVLDTSELLLVHRKIRAASYTHRGMDLPALFAEWDIDNDGSLTREEFYVAIKKLVSGITPAEFEQLCDVIDKEKTGEIDVLMIQEFVDAYSKKWKRTRVKRGKTDDNPVNDAVANQKWFGGLRPANNEHSDHSLKLHGRKKITIAEMRRLRKKVCADSYTAGGMNLRRVYNRLVPSDNKVDMKTTEKFLRLALPTLTCQDEVKYILSEWGMNKQNDGSLRYGDFQKWAKVKDKKKSVYRKSELHKKTEVAGLIPDSSRFKGHTVNGSTRHIHEDDMFNNLVPADLFADLHKTYVRKTSARTVEAMAAEAGIDVRGLPREAPVAELTDDDYEEYVGADGTRRWRRRRQPPLSERAGEGGADYASSGDDEDAYAGLTRQQRELREVLDLGTWSDSEGEGASPSSKGGGRGSPGSGQGSNSSSPSGGGGALSTEGMYLNGGLQSPEDPVRKKDIYGDMRAFGGGRFRMPQMPSLLVEGLGSGVQDEDALRRAHIEEEREEATVDYYWNKNIRSGKIPRSGQYPQPQGAASGGENGGGAGGRIHVNFVSDPAAAHDRAAFLMESTQTYGLFGKTSKMGGGGGVGRPDRANPDTSLAATGDLEDLLDPGTWNFQPGQALAGSTTTRGAASLFDSVADPSTGTGGATRKGAGVGGEPDDTDGRGRPRIGGGATGPPQQPSPPKSPRARAQQSGMDARQHGAQTRAQRQRGQGRGQRRQRGAQQQPRQRQAQQPSMQQQMQAPPLQKQQQWRQPQQWQQQQQQMGRVLPAGAQRSGMVPSKPNTMSPQRRRPNALRGIQPSQSPRPTGVRVPPQPSGGGRPYPQQQRMAERQPQWSQVNQGVAPDYGSVPPSPRSARSSNDGAGPRTNRIRSNSNAKWDPKLKKFVRR